ncbi:phage major tail tube protein [Tritonibacter mobilis]|uniref:phage major tail tube protein n=1 Tax=Tritonibacter mobilis TaxID=379347 RepID=UPI0014036939|nr:phage major tail tube protein [Tritonibacter mobilis]NHM19509.1 phage major tail tube protein [Tritonibacter mobilis]NHM23659.1 phage major tail tube protein [Tritonibacter mobilis]
MIRNILKNFNLFIDGRGFAGELGDYTPANPSIAAEEYRAGGMNGPIDIDMGQEKMTTSFVLRNYSADVLALWGVAPGRLIQVTARGALESEDGTVTPAIHNMRGKIIVGDRGTWSPGQSATLTFNMTLEAFKETIGGRVVCDIDVINMKRIIDGVDQLAEQRAALGI